MNDRIRCCHAVLGALVADAASLGLHWLYDQQRIRDVAAETPEFRNPTAADYEGVPGFYAHAGKAAGQFSHYGEQALVMLRSLVSTGGQYDKTRYQDRFCAHFGYGGGYVGYIDHPTRETLDNIARTEYAAIKRAEAIPFEDHKITKQRIIDTVLPCVKRGSAQLREQVEQAVRQADDDDQAVAFAAKVVDELVCMTDHHGANDVQLPAISKLPALVAVYAGNDLLRNVTASAVRVTNDNEVAVSYGHVAARIMEAAIEGSDTQAAIMAGHNIADEDTKALIDEVLELKDQRTPEVTAEFGMSCNLEFGLASVVHNLATQASYTEAIRQNIYAGGDACGRAILLGAVFGSVQGVGGEKGIPEVWIDKLAQKMEVMALLENLTGPLAR